MLNPSHFAMRSHLCNRDNGVTIGIPQKLNGTWLAKSIVSFSRLGGKKRDEEYLFDDDTFARGARRGL